MKKTKLSKAVVSVAAGVTVAAMGGQIMPVNLHSNAASAPVNLHSGAASVTVVGMVGQIMPVNLRSNPTDFADDTTLQQCCGPQEQSCPQFKCAAPY